MSALQLAEPEGWDPACRFFGRHPGHVCLRRDGRACRPGVDDCWVEARAQQQDVIRQQGRSIR